MSIFRFGKERTKAKSLKQAAFSNSSASDSFILEPILTPTAGFDGGDSAPDLAILRPDDQRFHLQDWIDTSIDRPTVEQAVEISSADPVELIAFVDDAQLARDGSIPDLLEELNLSPTPPLFESGVFTVGASGQVSIDFLFDGGGYEGQLAVFSLEGLERFELGSEEFIREAAYRALSHSELGYVVINDVSDSARFSGAFTHEGDVNGGDYQGVRTFAMRPGDSVGFMLVPNGTVQNVFDHPAIEGNQRPLFSLATANPNDEFQSGQIVDVTGEGNTFVFEDLRMDGHSDRDYNDVIFQVRGATGDAAHLDQVIDPDKDWRSSNVGKALLEYTKPYVASSELLNSIPQVPLPESPLEHQPLIGIIDTGFNAHNPNFDYSHITVGHDYVQGDNDSLLEPGQDGEHGTHILGIIGAKQGNDIETDGINAQAPIWVSRAVGSGQWAESLVEFVDTAKASAQPHAVVNLSFDLTQINPDGSVTTRYELTPTEWSALEYARQNHVLIVAAAGNDGSVMSALGQASQVFDNIITTGAAHTTHTGSSVAQDFDRTDYSSYGYGLDLVAEGGTAEQPVLSTVGDDFGTMAGTSVAAAKVTGAASQVWAANPELSYRQVIEILKNTAIDLKETGWDLETGAGLLNMAAAVHIAKLTRSEDYGTPEIAIPDTWSGAGLAVPTERAAAFDLNRIIGAAPSNLQSYARISIPLILAEAQAAGVTDLGQIAYILATAQHESHLGQWMEELASGAAYEGRRDLGNTQPGDGRRYKGRGYVQLTGRSNYTAWAQRLGLDLVNQPMRASESAIAAKIIVQGMRDGTFTGKGLSQYINGNSRDFVNARRIVNGTDKATLIAGYAENYLRALLTGANNPSPPVQPTSRRAYVVRSGDTLSGIALRELGNTNRWREISKDLAGQQFFTEAEARLLQIGRTVYLPVNQSIGGGRPIVVTPITPKPISTPDWQRAIDQAYANSPVNLGAPLGGYADAARSPQGTVGKFRNYQNGTIHWTQKYGAIPIWSDLQREYNQYSRPDGSGGWLGFPTRREYDWNGGKRTDFEGGYIFWNGQRAKAYRPGEMPPGTQPIRTGRVNARVGTIPLNLRSSAVVAANNKIGALSIGTSFKVLEQVNGGSYSTDAGNRTDWLKIQLNSGQQGYVAGYYVDIDSNNGGGGGNTGGAMTREGFVNWATGQVGIRRLDREDLRGQCVTLIARYIQEVFLSAGERTRTRAFGDGKDTARTVAGMLPNSFEPYTKTGLPRRGAVISFPGPNTIYGHTAIVMESRTFNGQRQVRIMDSNGDNRGVNSTVREYYSTWINIDSSGNGYGGTNGWTNPR